MNKIKNFTNSINVNILALEIFVIRLIKQSLKLILSARNYEEFNNLINIEF